MHQWSHGLIAKAQFHWPTFWYAIVIYWFFFSSIKNAFQPLGMNIRVRAALSRLIFYINIRSDCLNAAKTVWQLFRWNSWSEMLFFTSIFFFRFMIMSGHLFVYTHIPFYYIIVINTDTCVIVIFSFFYCIIMREWHLRMIYVIVKWKKRVLHCKQARKLFHFFASNF